MTGAANLAQGTWEDAEALVGTTIAVTEGADPVSVADGRRKLEVLGFDCPLHYDEDCARRHGHDTVISPVSMVRVWAMPAYWRPGEDRIAAEPMTTPIAAAAVPGEGDTMIATGLRLEHHAPLHPGDRVSASAVLKSVTRKTTRVGPGAFLVVETTYRNQRDEVVTVETATLLRYRRRADVSA
jgi:acyl dehydratase